MSKKITIKNKNTRKEGWFDVLVNDEWIFSSYIDPSDKDERGFNILVDAFTNLEKSLDIDLEVIWS